MATTTQIGSRYALEQTSGSSRASGLRMVMVRCPDPRCDAVIGERSEDFRGTWRKKCSRCDRYVIVHRGTSAMAEVEVAFG